VKFLDTFTDNEPFYNVTNPHTTCNNMLVGSNNYNRVGTKVQLKGLEYQFVVYRTAAGVTNTFPSAVRVVIVYDKEPIAGSTAHGQMSLLRKTLLELLFQIHFSTNLMFLKRIDF